MQEVFGKWLPADLHKGYCERGCFEQGFSSPCNEVLGLCLF